MDMTFRICKVKQDSEWAKWCKKSQFNGLEESDFIITGEEDENNYTIEDVPEGSLKLIASFKLGELGYIVPKNDVIKTNFYATYDIPKKRLTVDIIDTINRLNE